MFLSFFFFSPITRFDAIDEGNIWENYERFIDCSKCVTAKEQRSAPKMKVWLRMHVEAKLKSYENRTNDCRTEMYNHYMTVDSTGKRTFPKRVTIQGVKMCWACYAFLHKKGDSTVRKYRTELKSGQDPIVEHQGKGNVRNKHPAKKNSILEWLANLSLNLGCQEPNSEKIELPPGTKEHHHLTYQLDMEEKGLYHLTCSLNL